MMRVAVAILWQVQYWHRAGSLSAIRSMSIQNAGPGKPPGPPWWCRRFRGGAPCQDTAERPEYVTPGVLGSATGGWSWRS